VSITVISTLSIHWLLLDVGVHLLLHGLLTHTTSHFRSLSIVEQLVEVDFGFGMLDSGKRLTSLEAFLLLSIIDSRSNHVGSRALLKVVTLGHGNILEQSHVKRVRQNIVVDAVFHDLGLAVDVGKLIVSASTESLDTKTIGIVQFGGEPVLTRMVGQSLKVVAKLLVNFNLISVLRQVELLKAHCEEFAAAHNNEESNKEEEHGNGGTVLIPGPSIVIRRNSNVRVGDLRSDIVKDLLLSHDPVTEDKVSKRSPSHHAKGSIVEFGTVHRRFLVPVGDAELFNKVNVDKGKSGDGEHDGDSETVHEDSVDSVHASGILEMHKMDGASVQVDVLLNCLCLGLVNFATGPEVAAAFVQ